MSPSGINNVAWQQEPFNEWFSHSTSNCYVLFGLAAVLGRVMRGCGCMIITELRLERECSVAVYSIYLKQNLLNVLEFLDASALQHT